MSETAQVLIRGKDETAEAWASVQANASRTIADITSRLPALASALSAAGMVAFVKHTIDAADHLNDLSKSTGISVENLSGLSLLAKQTGTDMDGLAKGINRMSVEMGKDPEKFRQLGITATDNVGAFRQFADIFNKLPDINQRNALAQAVFNRSWQELAPAFSEGGAKIGEIIEAGSKASGMTSELARKSDELNDKWALLFRTGGTGNAVLKDLIDPLTSITNQMLAASKVSNGFFETLAKFTLLNSSDAKNPAKAIEAIDAELVQLQNNLGKKSGLTDISDFYDNFDAGIPARIALLESERKTLVSLQEVRSKSAEGDFVGPPDMRASADAERRAAAFMAQQSQNEALKKQWELTQMLIDADNRWDAMTKDHTATVRKLDDAQSASANAQLERLAQQENAMQADFNATEQRRLEDGLATRNSLRDATDAENLAYEERLANLTIYLNSVQASNTTAAAMSQALEVRHQQTLLQIETNKNASVRSMQIATWQAAGDLLQQFSGESKAAAIAVIAINKGLAIAQIIAATGVATMNTIAAYAWMGPAGEAAAAAKIAAINTLSGIQIGLVAATGLVEAAKVGGGGASAGSPANPINTQSSGFGTPFAPTSTAQTNSQTTIINVEFTGATTPNERAMLQKFVAMLNEHARDGGRIITA